MAREKTKASLGNREQVENTPEGLELRLPGWEGVTKASTWASLQRRGFCTSREKQRGKRLITSLYKQTWMKERKANTPRTVQSHAKSKNCNYGGSSIAALFDNLADAEINLEPLRTSKKFLDKERRNLDEIHCKKWQWIITVQQGICAAHHL